MNQVHALAVLGAGGFGQVLLVRYKGQYTALKCVAKAFVQEQGLVAHIKREKDHLIVSDTHTYTHTHMRAHKHTHTHSGALTGSQAAEQSHTHTHPPTHTHTHTHVAMHTIPGSSHPRCVVHTHGLHVWAPLCTHERTTSERLSDVPFRGTGLGHPVM